MATDPYIISNVIITAEDSDCVAIQNLNVHFLFRGCRHLDSGGNGISFLNVKNGMDIETFKYAGHNFLYSKKVFYQIK